MSERVEHGKSVHANGIDIHYTDTGAGEPLLLLDNAMVSTNPVWTALPFAYVGSVNAFATHFRVIAPDTRARDGRSTPAGRSRMPSWLTTSPHSLTHFTSTGRSFAVSATAARSRRSSASGTRDRCERLSTTPVTTASTPILTRRRTRSPVRCSAARSMPGTPTRKPSVARGSFAGCLI